MIDATTERMLDPLTLLAERATTDPDCMASALAVQRARTGLTEAEQRRHLGVRVADWPLFQLWRLPAAGCWDAELLALCERFGVDPGRLERLLQLGE